MRGRSDQIRSDQIRSDQPVGGMVRRRTSNKKTLNERDEAIKTCKNYEPQKATLLEKGASLVGRKRQNLAEVENADLR